MIYQVSSDGAIFQSDVNIVIYCIISRSHGLYDVQELKSKTIKELRATYIGVCKQNNYNEESRFCFSKKEAEYTSDYVAKVGFFPFIDNINFSSSIKGREMNSSTNYK